MDNQSGRGILEPNFKLMYPCAKIIKSNNTERIVVELKLIMRKIFPS